MVGEQPEDSLLSGGSKDHKDGLKSENRNSTGRLPNDAGTKTSRCLFGDASECQTRVHIVYGECPQQPSISDQQRDGNMRGESG